ncbi:MAG TPA: GGDEF domain-containing protein, partial [Burkholderiaceae bacterium]|nr:GGDEF domain-containing protein [Burkholderiaceae bacterium]
LGQNLSVERERQRSALLEWSQDLLFSLHRHPGGLRPIPALGSSEFGLWFHHKGCAMFDGVPEMEHLREAMHQIDESLLPRLRASELDAHQVDALLIQLQQELENLKFQLKTLFERQVEVENGRDTLTRLLNRRFLPSVVLREIRWANESRSRFGVLLLDVDHFKRINDEHGHDAGDLVLQQAAMLILDCVRNGDFVFRYGGEEILIVMVELDGPALLRAAEQLRQRFAAHEFVIGQGRKLSATISVGAALYDGHPDYQYLITRADDALYQAKHAGRDCVAAAPGVAELELASLVKA